MSLKCTLSPARAQPAEQVPKMGSQVPSSKPGSWNLTLLQGQLWGLGAVSLSRGFLTSGMPCAEEKMKAPLPSLAVPSAPSNLYS